METNIEVVESAIYYNPHFKEPLIVTNGYMYTKVTQQGLSYGQALDEAIHGGKKITRAVWKGYWEVGTLRHDLSPTMGKAGLVLVAVLQHGRGVATATPYAEDMWATDWMVVE